MNGVSPIFLGLALLPAIILQMNWHSIPIKEIADTLKTDIQLGLSEADFRRRSKEQGHNELPRPKPFTKIQILAAQFKNPLILILVGAGIITVFLRDFSDTAIIAVTIAINTLFGYFQELKTSKILESLRKAVKTKAFVIRDGGEKEIDQEHLVPGDIVIVKTGSKIPADGRVIFANELRVNESVLTGEWLSVEKTSAVVAVDSPVADRSSMVHMGTIVEGGEGKIIVTGTGKNTEIGRVVEATEGIKEEQTPYQKKLSGLSRLIGILVTVAVLLIFTEGILTGGNPREIFLISVAVAVAAIPEGLPMAMSVILAVGSQQILRKKGLVRRLASAETLGSTNIILMDKTGTLTEAKMKVSGIYAGENIFSDNVEQPGNDMTFSAMTALKSAVLSNEAFIENFDGPMDKWIIRGRPTERAVVEAGIKAGIIKREIEKKEIKVSEIVFSSEWRYSAVLHEDADGSKNVYSMGAPEAILEKVSGIQMGNKVVRITKKEIEAIINKSTELASGGARVIATARKEMKDHDDLNRDLSDMIFTGLIILTDPIRKEVEHALNSCRRAGIRPIIITGDNALTAQNIANSLGFEARSDNIMEGNELDEISDDDLPDRIVDIKIFARVAPVQKLRIVSAWQKRGQVVAMTGDGVNDAPAIKKADIGIALGSGTDAAKEAADFILLDDSFVVIETAIEEGRRILDNIQKVITYLLSDSFTETLLVGTALFIGLPIPVTAAQILWINLIEDGLPNVALAFEPKEQGIMLRKPNKKEDSLINQEMKIIIFVIGAITNIILVGIFLVLSSWDLDLNTVRTVVFALLAVNSLFYSFSCKNLRKNIWEINILSNKLLVFSSVFGLVALLSAVYVPFLNMILGTVPIAWSFWYLISGLAVINVFLIEVAKYYFIKNKLTE
ncbi:MAG: HAD-IC family P-type ATPase [Candidatus Colwellbacteria bacterium]|nr:HAD-IC family P-type ATPase [Candidatus Colwellbacteria bacterium]